MIQETSSVCCIGSRHRKHDRLGAVRLKTLRFAVWPAQLGCMNRPFAPFALVLESRSNGDPHQLRHAAGIGLGHEVCTVNLDCPGTDAEIMGDNLVNLAG